MGCGGVLEQFDGRNNGQDVLLAPGEHIGVGSAKKLLSISGAVDINPQMITITASVTTDQDWPRPVVGVQRLIQATIEWGVANVSQRAVVDLRNGMALSVPAASLDISVFWAVPAGPTSPSIRVKLLLGYQGRAGSIPSENTYTEPLRSLEGGGTTSIFQIPAFATTVSLLGTPFRVFQTQALELDLLGADGAVLTTFAPATLGLQDLQRIPLGALFYRVRNTVGIPVTNLFAVFGLAL